MEGRRARRSIDSQLQTASSLCTVGGHCARVLTIPAPHWDAKPFPNVFGGSFDYVEVPVVRSCLRPGAVNLSEASNTENGGPSSIQVNSPPLQSSPLLPARIAASLETDLSPLIMAKVESLLDPPPLKATVVILEDLSMNFGESDICLSLTGTVQVTSYAGGPAASKEPLEIGVELVDAASQVETIKSNAVVLRPWVSPMRANAGPIPETSSPLASFSPPVPSPTKFICRLPCTTDNVALPLNLLRYTTKSTVRPLPVRLQPSKISVEGDVAHIIVVVTSNCNLYVPLSAMSVTVEVHMPGFELGPDVISAMPTSVSWTPPFFHWLCPPRMEMLPGRSHTFRASLSIQNKPSPSDFPLDDLACVSSPSSSAYFPSGTVFRAKSNAALTKCTVRLIKLDNGAVEGVNTSRCEIQQEVRKRYRITAHAQAR